MTKHLSLIITPLIAAKLGFQFSQRKGGEEGGVGRGASHVPRISEMEALSAAHTQYSYCTAGEACWWT